MLEFTRSSQDLECQHDLLTCIAIYGWFLLPLAPIEHSTKGPLIPVNIDLLGYCVIKESNIAVAVLLPQLVATAIIPAHLPGPATAGSRSIWESSIA